MVASKKKICESSIHSEGKVGHSIDEEQHHPRISHARGSHFLCPRLGTSMAVAQPPSVEITALEILTTQESLRFLLNHYHSPNWPFPRLPANAYLYNFWTRQSPLNRGHCGSNFQANQIIIEPLTFPPPRSSCAAHQV